MCSLPTSCGQLQVKTSTCHHTLKGYVMSMPKARMPIVFFLSRSVHNTSLRLLQFINLRCMYYSFSESPRVKYSGLCMCTSHPLKRIKGKCSSIRLHPFISFDTCNSSGNRIIIKICTYSSTIKFYLHTYIHTFIFYFI